MTELVPPRGTPIVFFGISHQVGHYFDCALELGLSLSLVVMNMPEAMRPGTRTLADRLRLLRNPPRVIQLEEFRPREGECYFLGTTSPERRALVEDLRTRFGIAFCNLVHPLACVSPHATIATGTYVSAFTYIGPGAEIGEQALIFTKSHVAHDSIVGPYARLLAGCGIAGNVRVGAGATIGMSAAVIEDIEIGAEAHVAAGAVVIDDVPPRVLVAGVPAKIKKRLDEAPARPEGP